MLEDIAYDEIQQRELLEILSKLDKKLIFLALNNSDYFT